MSIMRKKKSWMVLLVMALTLFFGTSRAIAFSKEIIPVADAYIYAGSPDANFGNESDLKVQFGASADKWYKTYVRFEIGTMRQSFTDASLKSFLTYFVNYLDSNHMLNVYALKDGDVGENWDESTITWNNAPANDPTIGDNLISERVVFLGSLYHTDEYAEGAVTSFSNSSLLSILNSDTDGTVTFIITSETYWDMKRWYASKENTTYSGPTLALSRGMIPVADAYIYAGSPNTNFGSESDLKVQFGASSDKWYKTYLRFDIGTRHHSFTRASLKSLLTYFTDYLDSNHMLNIYALKDGDVGENWDESTITWNNAPANDPTTGDNFISERVVFLGSLYHTDEYAEGAVTSFSNSSLLSILNSDTDGTVTFIITSETYWNMRRWYASKENTANTAPTLDLSSDIIPQADAYIYAGSPDTNFGSENDLKVQFGASSDKWYKTYLRFDIGTPPHSFTDASLKSFLTYFADYLDSNHMLKVYALMDGDAGENWDESTITWNNAPANDPTTGDNLISERVVFLGNLYHTDDYAEGAVTSFSNSSLLSILNSDTDGKITFIITSETYWNMRRWYASKENTANAAPSLELLPQSKILLNNEGIVGEFESSVFKFELSEADYDFIIRENKQLCLYLDARIISGSLGGNTTAMTTKINGEGVKGRLLLNKPLIFTMREGSELKWANEEGFSYRLMYSPDYSDRLMTDETYPYGLFEPDQAPFHFVWDITSLVNVGTNELQISNGTGLAISLGLRDVGVEIVEPLPLINEPQVLPAPTGPLTEYIPSDAIEIPANIEVSNLGGIRFTIGGRTFETFTRTSLPNGNWCNEGPASSWTTVSRGNFIVANWNGSNYTVERKVTLYNDHITVADTISNTGTNLEGVIVENKLGLSEEPQETLLCGVTSEIIIQKNGALHPTAIAQYNDLVIGMAAEDDIFRMHCATSKESDGIVLADRQLGIAPGMSHTLEWSIYMVPGGDYWDFINAIRRNWGCNFTLKGPISFSGSTSQWWAANLTSEYLQGWLNLNPVQRVMTFNATNRNVPPAEATVDNPFCYHGTAILDAQLWLDDTQNLISKMAIADPTVEVFAYLHKNLCTKVGYAQMYSDSVALDQYGNPAVSLYTPEPGLFVPTLGNSYGAAMTTVYKHLVDNLNANIYVDEINLSYGLSNEWDGCTVDIDSNSHAVIAQKSSWLLMQPWLSSMMGYLNFNGKTAIANGGSATRTMLNWGIQYFFEEGMGPKAVFNGHLGTPLAWAGYLTGQAGYDHARQNLDYAGIAFTRSGEWNDYMFPITPIELRPGVVIAEERILTNRSGAFGWGDASHATVYVFDGQGNLVTNPDVAEVWNGNQLLTEIRMPSDHMAILIRIP